MQPNTPKGKQKKVKKESESKKKRRLIPFSIRRKSKLKETEEANELEISALDEISAKTLMDKENKSYSEIMALKEYYRREEVKSNFS